MFHSRSTRVILIVTAIVLATAGAFVGTKIVHRRESADSLLRQADKLAWNNRWLDAAPLYQRAEQLFIQSNRPSKALYSHVSQFIPRAETESIPDLLLELQNDLNLPQSKESQTRLRILVIKGMIESNYDAALARKTWKEIEAIAKGQHHYLLAARAMGEQGIAAFLLGDVSSAKKLVVRAWAVSKYLHDPAAHVRYASVYGAGLIELRRYSEALGPLDEAIQTATKSGEVAYPSIAVNSKIDALRGLHRYDEALALSDEAIKRLPGPHLDAHLFQLLTSKGEIYEELGHGEDAIHEYRAALEYAHRLKFWRGITQTGGLLARAYEHSDQLHEALNAINEAIAANTQIPQELYYVPKNLAIKAEILKKLGQGRQSSALYQKSAELIDSLITTVPTPNVERMLLSDMEEVYAGYFAALYQEGSYSAAFETVEKARGRIEAQALEHHEIALPHTPTNQERQLTELNLKLINTDDPDVRRQLAQTIYDTELQIDTPPLAGLTSTHPLPVSNIQSHLGSSEVLIEYVLADPRSYAMVITHNSINVYQVPSRTVIESDAARYRSAIRGQKEDLTLARTLFNELLAPIPEYRDHATVIVVPDGNLHLLPFSALSDGSSYTICDHTFSTSPSATVFDVLRKHAKATSSDQIPYIGVAAWTQVVEHKNPILRAISGPERSQLQPLPESQKEVETIAADLPKPDTVLLGSDATETRFKDLPLSKYHVLHLALHGYADVEFPDRSALVFAPSDKAADDGLLQIREIRNLHLNARLVTLSACNTGVGAVGVEGVANLVNAFIEAGAVSVVSTLWELEDQATSRLMMDFYSHLAQHRTKVDALRDAQLSLVKAGMPPYYWASFELVGDPDGSI